MTDRPKSPVLQLNASFEPLRIIPAWIALKMVTKGKAIVEVATRRMVYPGVYLPLVIRLRFYKHVPIRLQVCSRRNIYVRDGHRCMYCGQKYSSEHLTLDHIVPRAQGGRSEWANLVAACAKCNHRKADRTPEEAGMQLVRRPIPQTIHTPRFVLKALGSEVPEWNRFLYGDSEGEKRLQFS